MKTVKSFLIASILLVSSSILAQPPGGGQRGGQQGPPPIPSDKQIEEMVSDLSSELSLSDEQETTVLNLYKEHFEQIEDVTSSNSRPQREEMEALESSFNEDVKAELTEEQESKYETYLKEQQSQRKR